MQYGTFADFYDLLMDDIPYEDWRDYMEEIFKLNNLKPKSILDLACGTGNMTKLFHEKNYDVLGVDLSTEMLTVAKNKLPSVLFVNQNMLDLNLSENVDCCISLCDSMNYIHDLDDLIKIFEKINHHLNKDGLFIFDLNTAHKFENVLDGYSFSKIYDDIVCAWETVYDKDIKILEYYTNLFIKNDSDLFERIEEFHYEKAYAIDEIIYAIEKSGLKFLNVYDELTFDEPKSDSERIFFVSCRI